MNGIAPESQARFDELDALPTDQLRDRAFALARERHDIRFFISIMRHLPAAEDVELLDTSLGAYGASVDEAVEMWREFTEGGYGEVEPLLRAKFIDYLLNGE